MVNEVKDAGQLQAAESKESSTLAAVEAKMAAIQGKIDGDEEVTPETDEKEVLSDAADTKTVDTDSKVKDEDTVILPSGHRRAALARGYTNEEVDHYLEIKPDEATARFGEIFDDWQKENSRWSDRGRQLAAAKPPVEEGKEPQKETPQVLSHYDPKALIEEHGNEELINALMGPLNAMVDRVNTVTQKLSKSENFLRNTEENALVTITQDFLKSKEMTPFKETYGVEIKDLTDEQQKSRMELFGQADIIAAGAKDHGIDITVQDALERAHILVSQGSRDAAIRQSIRDSLTKRTKTIKSSHQKITTTDSNQPVSDEELEKRVSANLRSLRDRK